VSIIVEFSASKSAGVESHGVIITGVGLDRENGTKSIVGGVSFYDDGFVGDPVSENGSGNESGLECFERFACFISEFPFDTFASESSERNNDVGVVGNETAIEVSET